MDIGQLILLLSPLILLQLIVQLVAILDIAKRERHVKGGNKLVWVIVVVLGNLLGALVYFFAGREEA